MEKSIPEVIKGKDSNSNCEEYMKNKYGEWWYLIDTDTRKVFASCAQSMIKCVSGINHYGKIIKHEDKRKTTEECPLCGEILDCDHVSLCDYDKNKIEEWVRGLEIK